MQIKIENFRVLNNIEIDFDSDITLINAINRQGKSSIVKAYKLIMYNQLDEKLEDCINWNNNKSYFTIELSFSIDDVDYLIKYKYDTKTKTERDLYIGKEYYKNSDAVNKLAELFKPDTQLVSNFINQKELGICNITPSKRREYLKNIYNLDFKDIADEIDVDVKYIESELNKIDKQIYLLQNKDYHIEQLKDNPYVDKINDLQDRLYDINQIITDNESLNSNKQILIKSIDEKKNKLDEIIEDKQIYANKISELQTLNKNLHIQADLINDSKLKEITDSIDRFNKEVESIQVVRMVKFDDSEYLRLVNEKTIKQTELKANNLIIEDCKNGICPTCKKDFNSNDIEKYTDIIDDLKNDIELYSSKIKQIEQEKIVHLKLEEENNFNIKKRDDLKSKILLLQKDYDIEKQNIANGKLRIQDSILHNKESINIYQTNINDLLQKEEHLIVEINELNDKLTKFVVKDITQELREKLFIENSIKTYNEIITLNNNIERNNKQKEIEKIKDSETITELLNKQNEFLVERNNLIEVKDIVLKKFPNFVIGKLIQSIQDKMNNFIENVCSDKLNIKIVENKDSIYILYGDKQKDISLCSGFENELINIAYKISLLEYSDNRMLIIDEADSSADNDNALLFFKTLIDSIDKDFISKLVIITHKQEIKDLILALNNSKCYELNKGNLI